MVFILGTWCTKVGCGVRYAVSVLVTDRRKNWPFPNPRPGSVSIEREKVVSIFMLCGTDCPEGCYSWEFAGCIIEFARALGSQSGVSMWQHTLGG